MSGSGDESSETSDKLGARDDSRDQGEKVGSTDDSLDDVSLKDENVGSLETCLDGRGAILRRRPFEGGVGVDGSVGKLCDDTGDRGEEKADDWDEDGVDRWSNTVDELSDSDSSDAMDTRDDMCNTGDGANDGLEDQSCETDASERSYVCVDGRGAIVCLPNRG